MPGSGAQASGTGWAGWSWLPNHWTANRRVSLLADVYVNRLALPFLVPKLPTGGQLISKEFNLSSPCWQKNLSLYLGTDC